MRKPETFYQVLRWCRFLSGVDDDSTIHDHVKEHGKCIDEWYIQEIPELPGADDGFRYDKRETW